MLIICEKCGHEQEIDAPKIMGASGGKKSRRIITPEQQAKMQEARKNGKLCQQAEAPHSREL